MENGSAKRPRYIGGGGLPNLTQNATSNFVPQVMYIENLTGILKFWSWTSDMYIEIIMDEMKYIEIIMDRIRYIEIIMDEWGILKLLWSELCWNSYGLKYIEIIMAGVLK